MSEPLGYQELFVSLQNFKLTLNSGLVAEVTELSVKRKITFKERNIGDGVVRRVIVREDVEMSAKGWNGLGLSFKDINPGQGFSALAVQDEDEDFFQSDFYQKFPVNKWCFGDVSSTLKTDDPSDWDVELVANVGNVGATTVVPDGP